MAKEKNELISLKEAAEMSGYTSDYLGQLIRGGKLEGKQVFSNVVWMTTREAVTEYLKKDKKNQDATTRYTWGHFIGWLFSMEGVSVIYEAVTWTIIAALGIFILFLTYVFSVSIDHKIEQEHLKNWQPKSVYVP